MAILYGAALTEHNYDAFRRALTDAPASFQEWSHRRNQRAADTLGKGWKFVEVEIEFEDFKRDCDLAYTPYNLHALDNFAFKVAQRKK